MFLHNNPQQTSLRYYSFYLKWSSAVAFGFYIYIYAFSRQFYPEWHSRIYIMKHVVPLGISFLRCISQEKKKNHGPENVQRYKNTLKGTEEPQGHYVYNGKRSLWCVVDVAYLWPDQENFKAVLDPTSTLKELREEKNNNFVSSVWEQSLALVEMSGGDVSAWSSVQSTFFNVDLIQ